MKPVGFRIPVDDVETAVPFYREQLGFSVTFEAAKYGWATIARNGIQLGLYVPGKGGGTRRPGGSIDFSIAVPDLDALYADLCGIPTCSAIQTSADGVRLFDVTDPFENVITFMQA